MGRTLQKVQRFFRELRRRKVYRVAVMYAVVGFTLIELADLSFVRLGLPAWTVTFVIVLVAIGLPLALVLAWAFEMTPEGVRLTPGAEPVAETPEAADPGARTAGSWKSYLLGALTLGVLALSGWGVWRFVVRPSEAPSGVSPSVVAVLPFSVQGSGGMEYLGEGMVNLLTTKFDGAGDLRSVDARALLSHLQRTGGSPLDPEAGGAVARRFGAGLFVMGDIVEVGGRLTINAGLYDVSRGLPAVEDATVEGEADSISRLVDDLAAPLLAGVRGGPGGEATRMAALTTHSLPALRAYLEGESALRAGDYRGALEAFGRAVERDTLFALGYYRLSIAAEWLGVGDPMIQASERALRYADRMNDRYRRLLTAFRAFRHGENRRARELYRSIVAEYPDDVEAWLYLGEVLFHTNPYRGEPASESWEPFTEVIGYEPGNAASLVHMIRIAALEESPRRVDSLVDRYEQLNPEGDRLLSVRALEASVRDDEEMWRRTLDGLDASSAQTVALALWNVGVFGQDVIRAAELARRYTRQGRTAEERAAGFQWLAMAQAARGRWEATRRTLAALEELDPLAGLEMRGFLYLVPHAPVSEEELRTVRDRLIEHDATAVPPSDISNVFISVHEELHPFIRVYLLGRLNARLGAGGRARARAAELLDIAVPEVAGTMPEDLAHGIRAEVALQAGDSTTALEEIEKVRTDVVYSYTLSSFAFAEVHERFLRSELIAGAGRDREAVRWYANHVTTAIPEIAYLGLAQLGLARSLERLGDRAAAASRYRRFVELWSECDPELRPLVDRARQRLRELTASEAGYRVPSDG